MKILVVSDTHGDVKKVIDYIEDRGDIQKIFHLGDYTGDAKLIYSMTGIEVVKVKGNGDYTDTSTLEDQLIEVEGHKIFLTHGHMYGVKTSLNSIFYKAKSLGAEVLLFGHTHTTLLVEHEGITIINPGSPTIPRAGNKPSLAILTIDSEKIEKKLVDL